MANKLKITKLTKIHLVDKGAAINPRVLVIKRDKSRTEESSMPQNDKLTAAIAKAVSEAVSGVLKQDSIADQTPQQLIEQALDAEKVSEAGRAAILAALAAMYQSKPPATPAPAAPVEPEKAEGDTPPPPNPDDEKKPEDMAKILKSLTPELREIVEGAIKVRDEAVAKREDVVKRLESAEEEIAKAAAKADMADMVTVAKGFPFVPGDVKKRAGVLLSLKKSDPKAYDEMVTTLKASNELLKKGGVSKGTSRVEGDTDLENDDGESATAKLERMATEMLNKAIEKGADKGERKPTFAKMFARVAKANPKLRAQSRKEIRK